MNNLGTDFFAMADNFRIDFNQFPQGLARSSRENWANRPYAYSRVNTDENGIGGEADWGCEQAEPVRDGDQAAIGMVRAV